MSGDPSAVPAQPGPEVARPGGGRRRSLVLMAWLLLVWLALWGDADPLTVIGGLLFGLALTLTFRPNTSQWIVLRPWAAAHFLVHFLVQLAAACARLVRVVLDPRPPPVGGIIAIDVQTSIPAVVTLIAISTSLTPGTLVVATRPLGSGTRLYVHILDADRRDRDHESVLRVEELAVAAFAPRTPPLPPAPAGHRPSTPIERRPPS